MAATTETQRKWRAPTQVWLELGRDENSITLLPTYPTGKSDQQVTMPLNLFAALNWEEVK